MQLSLSIEPYFKTCSNLVNLLKKRKISNCFSTIMQSAKSITYIYICTRDVASRLRIHNLSLSVCVSLYGFLFLSLPIFLICFYLHSHLLFLFSHLFCGRIQFFFSRASFYGTDRKS